MALGIGKYFKPAKLPIIPIVLLAVLATISIVPQTPFIITIVMLPIAFIGILLSLAWAGFRAVKGHNMDLLGAALSGSAAGLGSVIILSLILIVLMVLNLPAHAASAESNAEFMLIIATMIFSLAMAIPIAAIASIFAGAIMGLVGAFVAQMKK
ncbi:MAG: hypothetical protein PHF60_04685 [Candidatus ainarchaeum sp.]|nr:hypothetical protein [Candidatus ainarchaeum sp.]